MKLSQLENLQKRQILPVVNSTIALFQPYKEQKISTSLWLTLLNLLFGVVQPAAGAVSSLARTFYDEERERHYPDLPRHDFYLSIPNFDMFVEDMEYVRSDLSKEITTDGEIAIAAQRVARHIENSGRRTIKNAVLTDPLNDDDFVVTEVSNFDRKAAYKKGSGLPVAWARVATGLETCGWCLMLVSRGPVYNSAHSAGDGEGWHNGCDCKVVPVFTQDSWEGRERYQAALEMWKRASKNHSGKDAINEMRKAASRGEFQEILKEIGT